jgi:hypothetical protein
VTPDDREFEQWLRPRLRALGAQRGSCPPAEALVDFEAGELPAEQAEAVRRHIERCGVCDALLVRLRESESHFGVNPEVAGAGRARENLVSRWRRVFLHPAAGYALGTIAVVAVLLLPRQSVSEPPRSEPELVAPVEVVDLTRVRAGSMRAVVPADHAAVLSFFVAIHPDRRYTASLDSQKSVPIESHDGHGNFRIYCDARHLSRGNHQLLVIELDPTTGHTYKTFEFTFETQ